MPSERSMQRSMPSQRATPTPRSMERSNAQSERSRSRETITERRSNDRGERNVNRNRSNDENRVRNSQRQERERVRQTERKRDMERNRNAQERNRVDRNRSVTEERNRVRDRNRANDRNITQDRNSNRNRNATQNRDRRERVQLSADQRNRVRQTFARENFRAYRQNVNFRHRVGDRVPRNLRLRRLPVAIFAFAPFYRDYSYFVVDNDICIVDPVTYEIVEVIDEGPAPLSSPQVAELVLSPSQRSFLLDRIDWDASRVNVDIDLALGADVPEDVRISAFQPMFVDEISSLRGYSYFTTGNALVIVKSDNRDIVLVIRR